ncbi:MAG TPA: hypothetical protein ENJ09_04720 [Planctomycetes bacterium]|nr:hypothetical protein [Planctomycetota bacterium]
MNLPRWKRSPAVALGLALLASAPAFGQTRVEAGAIAPPGRWPMEGGSPSGTGTSLAPAVRAEPRVAWEARPGGTIEGEPLVFDGVVLVASRSGAGRRTLTLLDIEDGRVLLHQVLPASLPLHPVLWHDRILVRPEANRIDVYRVRAGRLLSLRTIRAQRSVSPPLVADDRLFVRLDAELTCFDLGVAEPAWKTRVEGSFRGTPALRGESVFALFDDPSGTSFLGTFLRANGKLARAVAIAPGEANLAEPENLDRPVVMESAVVVRRTAPFPTVSGQTRTHALIARSGVELGSGPARLLDFTASPVAVGTGWIARLGGGPPAWVSARLDPDGLRVRTLADAENHAELLAASAPPTRTGNTIFFAGLAYDAVSGKVLWKREPSLTRAVPADGTLLVVERPDTLTALREPAPSLSPARARARALRLELVAKSAEDLALHAARAARLGDRELVAAWIDEAVRNGARGRSVDSARDALERIPRGADPVRVDPIRRRTYIDEADRIREAAPTALLEAALDSADPALRRALLSEVLEMRPDDDRARAAVLAMLPSDAPDGARERTDDAESWLDFLDASARTPVRILVPGRASDAGPELDLVLTARDGWRDDLIGVLSNRLLIVAGPDHPGEVARCLEIGELVCDVLEDFFDTSSPAGAQPLTLYLYDSRETYVTQSRRNGESGEAFLGWSVGHYSPGEDLSRMYVPADPSQVEELLGTYAHELTHHWLQDRAPFRRAAPNAALPFWIVEGFARMVEEFRLDAANGTFDPVNPRASSLDLVAHAGPGELLPWPKLVSLDQASFQALGTAPHASIPLAWTLGTKAQPSEIQLFYAQAAALCHALDASADGRRRLLGALRGWYEASPPGLAPGSAFPVPPEELDAFVRPYARRTVEG